MAKTDQKLPWIEIDPATLSPRSAKLYDKLKAARKASNDARDAFEESVRDEEDVPSGKRLVFGYNFGKLSTALADDEPRSKAKPKVSLTEYLAAMKATGGRV